MNLKDWWWGRGELKREKKHSAMLAKELSETEELLENYRRMASVHLEKDIGRAAIRHVELARSSWVFPVATLSNEQVSDVWRVEYGTRVIGASVMVGLPETLGRESIPLVAAQLAMKFTQESLEPLLMAAVMEKQA